MTRALQIAKNLKRTIEKMDDTVRPQREIHYVRVTKSELNKRLKYIIKKYKLNKEDL
tara:strand:- start:1162 stop:1332 length:171 start_codon:yes stop_codon:yes gene_type:complete